MRLLILGGTTEAGHLAKALAPRHHIDPVLSLAGRTEHPAVPPIPYRIGGFGGMDGLATFIRDERIQAVVDATHPFAAQISAHAVSACMQTNIPIVAFTRPPWQREAGDHWRPVPDISTAVQSLGETPHRVFLTTGRLDLAAFKAAPRHHYVIRTIDPPDPADLPPRYELVSDRGPFTFAEEHELMRSAAIELLVTKNSGGMASAAKLEAARSLGLPIVVVERPVIPPRPSLSSLDDVLAWIEAHRPRP